MRTRKIVKSEITEASYAAVLQKILYLAQEKISSYVCIANVHMVIEAYWDSKFNEILSQAAIVTPDGKPLSVAMNWLYETKQERIAGPDLMLDLFKEASNHKLSIFFYGATEPVLNNLVQKLSRDFPQLSVAGVLSPPFRMLSDSELDEHATLINQSNAQLVLVALGCPKQERWMYRQQGKIQAVMVGVGAAFPFYTGELQRAPLWMQHWGLEWFFRLISEPRRLFKRYLVTNSLFLILTGLQLFKKWCRFTADPEIKIDV